MLLSKKEEKAMTRRLLESRLRILCTNGFYGMLLMHLSFSLDDKVKNVGVDRKKIYFNPTFLDGLTEQELDLVMLHEVIHLSLKHNFRKKDFSSKKTFDEAADIVVNSYILESYKNDEEKITFRGEILPHKSPNNKEGRDYSVEQLYAYLDKLYAGGSSSFIYDNEDDQLDDHGKWMSDEADEMDEKEWEQYNLDACETMYIRDPSNSRGTIPGYAARAFKQLKNATTDWRTLLNNFVQENVNDYTFSPPDRRFSDSPFFLPDFNDSDEVVKDVLFMIDTSGSMSDAQITTAFSEVKGAIDQFNGKLQGWLGFFDAAIVEPKPFTDEDELKIIHPFGGGGTDFGIVFRYIRDKMQDRNISSIVILTDGYCPFPKEEAAMDIPVIWLINNQEITPPWGKVARLPKEDISSNYN